MSNDALNIRAFAETIRSKMNKKSSIKDFDIDSETPQSQDLSKVFRFYYHLLKSVIYYVEEDGVPDIAAPMATQLKQGKTEVHPKIKEIAQRSETRAKVVDYFSVNLIPNIPKSVLSTVLDDVDSLVQNDKGLGRAKRKALKELRTNSKDGSSYLADVWLLAICNGTNVAVDKKDKTDMGNTADTEFSVETTGGVLDKVDSLLSKLSRPPTIEPSEQIEEHELLYIAALHMAYSDVLGIESCDETVLECYPIYKDDLAEQRIDYFAAYSVERGVLEFNDSSLSSQFDVLKNEIYDGVKSTAKKSFANGYEKLLGVLEQAVAVPVSLYVLSRSPYWISNKIKKGTCHFLVIDGKLIWVSK